MNSSLPNWIQNPNPGIYNNSNYLVLDFETTNKDKGSALNKDNNLLCGVWKYKNKVKKVVGNEFKFGQLLEDIEKADFVVAHNAKFELQWLQRCGLNIKTIIIYDTQISEYVILGNRNARLDLNSVAHRYNCGRKLDLVSGYIKSGTCPSELPSKWLVDYNIQDVELTEEVFLKQLSILNTEGLLPVVYTRCMLTPVLADIEQWGMFVDADRVNVIHARLTKKYNKVLKELNELTGGINPRSPKQVGEYLYDTLKFKELSNRSKAIRSPAGNRKTDLQTILKLKCTNKTQRKFIELKKEQAYLEAKLSKSVSKFYDSLQDEEEPGLIRAQFNQTITQTHRLSSTGRKYNLQFQNFDREFKPVFRSRYEDYNVGEADYAQLEFRGAAFLGQDSAAITSILNKEDVHKFTASVLNKISLDEVTSDLRQDAKPETFKPLYGGEYGTKDQMAYYKAFREKYPDIAKTQESWAMEVLHTGKLKTCTGLIFYWPGTKMKYNGQIENKTSIYNYPVQSLATADIVPIGVTCLWHRIKSAKLKSFLVNTIHDSAIAEIAPGEEEAYSELVQKAFVDDVYNYLYNCYNIDFNIPLEVDVSITKNWKDSESWANKWLK